MENQARSQEGSGGSEEPPSWKRSTISVLIRFTILAKSPQF